MDYISTRGSAPALDFAGTTLAGLASDGGLYVPREWPRFTAPRFLAYCLFPGMQPRQFLRGQRLAPGAPVPTVTGAISAAKFPFSHASAARRWLWAENRSCSARLTPNFAPMYSADSPIAQFSNAHHRPSRTSESTAASSQSPSPARRVSALCNDVVSSSPTAAAIPPCA